MGHYSSLESRDRLKKREKKVLEEEIYMIRKVKKLKSIMRLKMW